VWVRLEWMRLICMDESVEWMRLLCMIVVYDCVYIYMCVYRYDFSV
jgi:hypothetical protein